MVSEFIAGAASQGELGRRGRGTSAFEMVLFPARTAEIKFYWYSEKFKLHPLVLSDCKIRYLNPPTAPKIERSVNSARERKGTAKTSNFIGYPTKQEISANK